MYSINLQDLNKTHHTIDVLVFPWGKAILKKYLLSLHEKRMTDPDLWA